MFGLKEKKVISKSVQNEIQKEAACHAQTVEVPAVEKIADRELPAHTGNINSNGWFYRIYLAIRRFLKAKKAKKVEKPIEAEFYSHVEKNAELEKAKGKTELEKVKHSGFLIDWFLRL